MIMLEVLIGKGCAVAQWSRKHTNHYRISTILSSFYDLKGLERLFTYVQYLVAQRF